MTLQVVDYQSANAAETFVASLREYGFASSDKHNWQFDPVTMDGFLFFGDF